MIILNDPVVNDGQLFGGRIMRMCIFVVGLAVGGPPGVAHPNVAVEVLTLDELLELNDLSFLFINVESPVHQGNASAVVPAVLQTLETLDDHLFRLTVTHIANNSTHWLVLLSP